MSLSSSAFRLVMARNILTAFSLNAALFAVSVEAKDVTSQVIKETDLDERVAAACARHCQGNKRQGRLTRVTVERSGSTNYAVRGYFQLSNRHDPVAGVTAWSYTINVEAHGTLDGRTCRLTVNRIKVINDTLGLGSLARREEGKVHDVKDCRRFLTGL